MVLAYFGVGVEDIFLVYFKLFSWIIAGHAHQFMTTVYTSSFIVIVTAAKIAIPI